jgi:hypothetical protein
LHEIGQGIFEGSAISPVLRLRAFWLTDKAEQMGFDGWLRRLIGSVMSRMRVWSKIEIGDGLLFTKKNERMICGQVTLQFLGQLGRLLSTFWEQRVKLGCEHGHYRWPGIELVSAIRLHGTRGGSASWSAVGHRKRTRGREEERKESKWLDFRLLVVLLASVFWDWNWDMW